MIQTNTSNEMFIPPDRSAALPLLVALHGGGRDGQSQIDLWRPLAAREKFIVLAPSSADSRWYAQEDFGNTMAKIRATTIGTQVDINRVYFLGHSLGAVRALFWGFTHRAFIAAAALHSPCWEKGIYDLKPEPGSRRLPLGIWVGSENSDPNWHCAGALKYAYKEHPNFLLDEPRVLPKHEHNDIYRRPGLTDDIWDFLKQYRL